MSEYLYVIKDSTRPNYKIGIARNVKSRMNDLQIANATELQLVLEIPILTGASKVERSIHKVFQNKQLQGEWFRLTSEDVAAIPRLAREYSIFGRKGRLPDNWKKMTACIRHSAVNCRWCQLGSEY